MNILILNWRDIKNPISGGAEIVTFEHAKAWVKSGNKVTWFASRFGNSKANEKIEGINFVRRGNFITVYLYAPFFYLFSKQKFDLVVDEIHGLPFFTPIYVRKPKIALIHEVAGEIWDYMFPFPISFLGKLIEPLYFKLYGNIKFWVPSESTRQDLIKQGVNDANIINISCGKNTPIASRLPKKTKEATFIFVSRVVKMKGVEEVIKSFSYILREMKSGKLWIVGDGDPKYMTYLRKLINEYSINENVIFFGRVTENKKIELMDKAHLLLHASVKEGWGLVVIEAASRGTPSVVYNVAGLRDSVVNGKTGVVVRENTPRNMAKEAIGLVNDRSRYLSYQKSGIVRAKTLTWEKATKQSLDLIKNVTKGS